MVDAVLVVAEAVIETGSPQSSEFSLLLAKCLMSTLRTFDNEDLSWCFLPLAEHHIAETPIIEMSKFLEYFWFLLIQLLNAGSKSHSS